MRFGQRQARPIGSFRHLSFLSRRASISPAVDMTDRTSGFSPQRLARIPRFLERQVAEGRIPGSLLLIWRRGRIVHQSLTGAIDLARGTPMREDAIFRIYSMTKPLTAVALLMLMEEGKVALDDPVHRFIPEFADLGVYAGGVEGGFATIPANRPMTILDLLRHTSGLTYGFTYRTPVDAAYRRHKIAEIGMEGGLPAMIAALAQLPLEFSPGDAWLYSVASDVLGHVIARIEGEAFADILRRRILRPLDMRDTDFLVPRDKQDRFAACYAMQGGKLTLFDDNARFFAPPRLESGGGGLVGTAADYMRFCRMLLNQGDLDGVRLLGPKTVALMTANHLPGGADIAALSPARDAFNESGHRGIGFGLGLAVTLDPARTGIPGTAGEFSWGGMASTAFFVDPKEEMAVVFMTQVIAGTGERVRLRRDLRTMIYAAMTESFA
jgi:CubicO group peptidase (beta-lactamase class C family)